MVNPSHLVSVFEIENTLQNLLFIKRTTINLMKIDLFSSILLIF